MVSKLEAITEALEKMRTEMAKKLKEQRDLVGSWENTPLGKWAKHQGEKNDNNDGH